MILVESIPHLAARRQAAQAGFQGYIQVAPEDAPGGGSRATKPRWDWDAPLPARVGGLRGPPTLPPRVDAPGSPAGATFPSPLRFLRWLYCHSALAIASPLLASFVTPAARCAALLAS